MIMNNRAGSVVFENITKIYGNNKSQIIAIDNVSFIIQPGELVTLLGPSGCGKTTMLRMIAGLEHPTSGNILIGNKNVTQLPATDRDVSMVFQSYALFPHMTVAENVAYGLRVSGMSKSACRDKAEVGLEMVGLSSFGNRLPSQLSGGQQQRVAVARALVLEPEVLLLDEPLSNLDAKLRRHVRTEIRDIQQKLGLTAVYVTHDQEEALAVSDRVIVMNRAVIAQQGTPQELYEQPDSSFIADFIGNANLISAAIRTIEGEFAEVVVENTVLRIKHRQHTYGAITLVVRPDAIQLVPVNKENVPQVGAALMGEVTHATYLGGHIEYLVECSFGALFVIDRETREHILPSHKVIIQFADHGITLVRS